MMSNDFAKELINLKAEDIIAINQMDEKNISDMKEYFDMPLDMIIDVLCRLHDDITDRTLYDLVFNDPEDKFGKALDQAFKELAEEYKEECKKDIPEE